MRGHATRAGVSEQALRSAAKVNPTVSWPAVLAARAKTGGRVLVLLIVMLGRVVVAVSRRHAT